MPDIDLSIIQRMEKLSTGSTVHEINRHLHIYKLNIKHTKNKACQKAAEKAKRKLLEIERQMTKNIFYQYCN